jgi:NitT/TauT family transport system substrate-binding protein
VKAIASLGSMPNYLLSNNPAVKSIKDLSAKDRIAVPAAGVGFQSRTLQIETAKLYGDGDFKRFDKISVSLPHPDASAALIAGGSEITTHFSSPPFQYQALEHKNVHKVLSSYDVLGDRQPLMFSIPPRNSMMKTPEPIKRFIARSAKPQVLLTVTKMPLPKLTFALRNRGCLYRWYKKLLTIPK